MFVCFTWFSCNTPSSFISLSLSPSSPFSPLLPQPLRPATPFSLPHHPDTPPPLRQCGWGGKGSDVSLFAARTHKDVVEGVGVKGAAGVVVVVVVTVEITGRFVWDVRE